MSAAPSVSSDAALDSKFAESINSLTIVLVLIILVGFITVLIVTRRARARAPGMGESPLTQPPAVVLGAAVHAAQAQAVWFECSPAESPMQNDVNELERIDVTEHHGSMFDAFETHADPDLVEVPSSSFASGRLQQDFSLADDTTHGDDEDMTI